MSKINNLYTREECPFCHFAFISGFDQRNERKCPSCNQSFISGENIDHGKGCSVCSNRYRGSNNVYYKNGCPAIMSDGRFITNYNSSNELTENMRKLNGFKNHNQFRNFMQRNANLIMNAEREHLMRQNTCSPNTACSEGWNDLWEKKNGRWA